METLKFIILLLAATILAMIALCALASVADCVFTFFENRRIAREYMRKRKG